MQYVVSGDQYYVPDSKLSASSVHSGLGVIYSRLTNEHQSSGSWSVGVDYLNQDDQFIQVIFIMFFVLYICHNRFVERFFFCLFIDALFSLGLRE